MQTHRVEVLVVADDAAMRTMVRLLLEEAGYAVYEAPDGRPALERLYTHAQGMVVLLDLNMPGMDGLAVLQALLTEPTTDPQLATCHRLILTTAQATDTLPPALLALLTQGALTLLPKPFEVEELLQAMAVAASQLHAALPAAPPIPPLPPSTPPVLLSPAADATTAATSLDRPEPRPHPRYPYPQRHRDLLDRLEASNARLQACLSCSELRIAQAEQTLERARRRLEEVRRVLSCVRPPLSSPPAPPTTEQRPDPSADRAHPQLPGSQ